MTEAKKITNAISASKALELETPDLEDNSMFALHVAERLRRLPMDTRFNAMMEILAILNRFLHVQSEAQ